MAYLNNLASVPAQRIVAFRKDPTLSLHATKVEGCSHLIAYWVKIQPLGELLGKLIDGGELLQKSLWHPLRQPVFHGVAETRKLAEVLSKEWSRVLEEMPASSGKSPDNWYKVEIEKVLSVLNHAAQSGECFVSVLEPPLDEERARKVTIPRLD